MFEGSPGLPGCIVSLGSLRQEYQHSRHQNKSWNQAAELILDEEKSSSLHQGQQENLRV